MRVGDTIAVLGRARSGHARPAPGPRSPHNADVAVAAAPIMPDGPARVKRRPGSGVGHDRTAHDAHSGRLHRAGASDQLESGLMAAYAEGLNVLCHADVGKRGSTIEASFSHGGRTKASVGATRRRPPGIRPNSGSSRSSVCQAGGPRSRIDRALGAIDFLHPRGHDDGGRAPEPASPGAEDGASRLQRRSPVSGVHR